VTNYIDKNYKKWNFVAKSYSLER